jgi:hypothetical protein
MTEEKLRQMLQKGFTHESSFVERKPGNFKDREARKTIVAFANSTPEGQECEPALDIDHTSASNSDQLVTQQAIGRFENLPRIPWSGFWQLRGSAYSR